MRQFHNFSQFRGVEDGDSRGGGDGELSPAPAKAKARTIAPMVARTPETTGWFCFSPNDLSQF